MKIQLSSTRKISGKRTLTHFAQNICQEVHFPASAEEIHIQFVSDSTIQKIHQQFLKDNRPTDVITFCYPPYFHGKEKSLFGEILISLDTARRQAREGGHTLLQESALLILHGILHLVGYEDDTPSHRRRMFSRQREIFRKISPHLAPPDFF